ncbi:hypothetical protein B0H17DRAFT_1252130 [Mycena rosella]|uniref:Uncharacterized protein n=1 Tax=Mycena rosella TaxID=1033263 RepID=A0AAD7CZW0_MYCRO|nr:hypothetical protein B0H17DRAFT_1252130 [Mycena rosella]
MKYLGDFIRRLDGIQQLHLYFAGNLLNSHTIDTIFPYSPHDLLTEFFDVIRGVVEKLGAPVVVLIDGKIYRALPRDLADWGLRYSLYWEHLFGKIGWVDRAQFLLTNKGDPHLFIPVCRPNMRQEIEYTRHLHSVNVRAIPPASAVNKAFTFVTLETDTTTTLYFGPSRYYKKAALCGPELNTVIPHIMLPSLRTLNINHNVDPTVLHDFLCRHFTIVSIDYRVAPGAPTAHADTEQDHLLPRRILTSSPLALPSLSHLSFSEVVQMIILLDTFHLSTLVSPASPQLKLPPSSVRCVGCRCTWLWLPSTSLYGCSYGIRCVHIRAGEMSEVQPFIPWLEMLPALTRLEVSVFSWLAEESVIASATASELEKLRAALPWHLTADSSPNLGCKQEIWHRGNVTPMPGNSCRLTLMRHYELPIYEALIMVCQMYGKKIMINLNPGVTPPLSKLMQELGIFLVPTLVPGLKAIITAPELSAIEEVYVGYMRK